MSLFARSMFTTTSRSHLTIYRSRHPSEKVTRVRHDESTSNLVRHADNCDPNGSLASQAMSTFVKGSTYNPGKLRLLIATWVARRHQPFKIVEDPEFVEILQLFNSRVAIPSRFTVSRDIQEIFQVSQQIVATTLQVSLPFFVRKSNLTVEPGIPR
jgi:hypothetical protein